MCGPAAQRGARAGGDGPRRGQLERMVAEHELAGRVEMVGSVPHECARDLLVRPSACLRGFPRRRFQV